MPAIQRILVPVDFSECSEPSVALALDIAHQYGAEVSFVHVLHEPTYPSGMAWVPPSYANISEYCAAVEEDARRTFGSLLRGRVPDWETRVRVRWGIPFHEIVTCAREEKADLIVMGTHGRTGVSRVVMGSVTEKVLRTAPCAVLAVKPAGFESAA